MYIVIDPINTTFTKLEKEKWIKRWEEKKKERREFTVITEEAKGSTEPPFCLLILQMKEERMQIPSASRITAIYEYVLARS